MAPRKKAEPPIVRNPRIVVFGEIVVDEGSKCVFEPWMDDGRTALGYQAVPVDDKRVFFYIAPDIGSDGMPGFFLFIGPHGDPAKDTKIGPYQLEGPWRSP